MESFDSIQGLSTLESLRGSESPRILPSVLPAIPCRYRVGSTDLSRLTGTVSPPSRAMLLTRQGISLDLFLCKSTTQNERRVPFTFALACRHADGTISSSR